MTENRYYALIYLTMTGQVVDEIPLNAIPVWSQVINNDGSWRVSTLIGPDNGSSGMTKAQLHAITNTWRHSVAICWGNGSSSDYVCQAGPLTSRVLVSEHPPILQLGGTGFWPLLRKVEQVASTWNGVSLGQGAGADTSYTGSMAGVAYQLLVNALARGGWPLDLTANTDTGTVTEAYFGYDLISAGQRLQELTQMANGPDILFKPYLTGTGFVRHRALIGQPSLVTTGIPLVFDYPGNITSILSTDDGTSQSTATYTKGNGIGYGLLWAVNTANSLRASGWPLLENTDTGHTSVTDQPTLTAWAGGTQALTTYPIGTWTITARQDNVDHPFGSYDVGSVAAYVIQNHPWLVDGTATLRVLGLQNGNNIGEVLHLVQTIQQVS